MIGCLLDRMSQWPGAKFGKAVPKKFGQQSQEYADWLALDEDWQKKIAKKSKKQQVVDVALKLQMLKKADAMYVKVHGRKLLVKEKLKLVVKQQEKVQITESGWLATCPGGNWQLAPPQLAPGGIGNLPRG